MCPRPRAVEECYTILSLSHLCFHTLAAASYWSQSCISPLDHSCRSKIDLVAQNKATPCGYRESLAFEYNLGLESALSVYLKVRMYQDEAAAVNLSHGLRDGYSVVTSMCFVLSEPYLSALILLFAVKRSKLG